MNSSEPTRYEQVSRRAILRASIGAGAFVFLPSLACGTDDAEVFAGAAVDPPPTTAATPLPTTPPLRATPSETQTRTTPPLGAETAEAPTPTATPPDAATPTPVAESSPNAVQGEMVISFTYTQAPGGKNEWPYVAVWIEDSAGDLAETIAIWYQQGRRGDRWLDHLSRWYGADLARVSSGGTDDVATISGATRPPGSYGVVWDGTIGSVPALAGDYFVCVEAVREDGPYSLIREPFALSGSLSTTPLPDNGELSASTVRIDV